MRSVSIVYMLLACLSGAAAAEMTPEEIIVRNAYAKLSYAVDINTAYRAVRANPQIDPGELARQIELKGLRFQLSNFTVGNLADVADSKYADVAGQYPDGQDVIHESVATESFGEIGSPTISTETATAEWGPGPNGRIPDVTIKEMMPVMEQEAGIGPLRRYCSFTVTVALMGRNRTYRAAFFFADKHQVAPGDVVAGIGGGALRNFVLRPLYPDILLRTSLWKISAVRNFLILTQRGEPSCKAGSGDVCCDVVALQCGVARADL